ncbi:unnamed protein product [Pieris brassicae]|uniref:Uncharacterized protein n=1 Tax=Pieris brassicae TaxID=7116 RepID=A0A9P0THM0_PIEBR|nr:unnamed protein product [Pieris brassicae]
MKRIPQIGEEKRTPRPQRPRSHSGRAKPPAGTEDTASTGPSPPECVTAHSSAAAKQQAAPSCYSFAEPASQQQSRSRSMEVPRDRHPSHQRRDLTPAARSKKTVRIAAPLPRHPAQEASVTMSAATSRPISGIHLGLPPLPPQRASSITAPGATAFLSAEISRRGTGDHPEPRAPLSPPTPATSVYYYADRDPIH